MICVMIFRVSGSTIIRNDSIANIYDALGSRVESGLLLFPIYMFLLLGRETTCKAIFLPVFILVLYYARVPVGLSALPYLRRLVL